MLIYLHSLHNLLQDAQTISEFLEKALYQTTYTFNLQSGFIALLDQSAKQKFQFTLVAQNGKVAHLFPYLHSIISPQTLSEMKETKEPYILSDIQSTLGVSLCEEEGNLSCSVAFFPLIAKGELLGLMALERVGKQGFDAYDLMRLGIAADEIASEILVEQQKQKQIALMERQRLVRDLHDSITQQLYGLVTVTEAIQIGLQAGAVEKIKHLLPQINASARQALREMRLFLYELNPIDLEKEGLIQAIRLRLASVEERSNIRVRFIHKGRFTLSKEQELALYYIVEESLNNALKHAQATEILIQLERRKNKLYLKVIDNGSGFSVKNIRPGGKGIENMRIRALQIGAVFRISSSGQKGTRVSVTLPLGI
ncbi:MAG: GAF domain-containing sensor histidine kinase [Anaerolineales bacterium]|nr:GAF domain-containing sensor histidine kinase [Anaerolineales bacterium]